MRRLAWIALIACTFSACLKIQAPVQPTAPVAVGTVQGTKHVVGITPCVVVPPPCAPKGPDVVSVPRDRCPYALCLDEPNLEILKQRLAQTLPAC